MKRIKKPIKIGDKIKLKRNLEESVPPFVIGRNKDDIGTITNIFKKGSIEKDFSGFVAKAKFKKRKGKATTALLERNDFY